MPIFDQGYQHWSGTLSGHAWRWLTIARRGVAATMGGGSGFSKFRIIRIVVLFSWLPAACLAFMVCVWGLVEQQSPLIQPILGFLGPIFPPDMLQNPKNYRVEVWTLCFHFFFNIQLYVSMIVVLLVGPGLISQDLRFNALPLYFSRPLRRLDYFGGKLGVIGWFLCLVIIFPCLIAYILGLLFSLDITILWDTLPLLFACIAYGLLIVLSAGMLMLALSSISRNSRYVILFWIALWSIGALAGTILTSVDMDQRRARHWRKQYATQFQPPPVGANQKEQMAMQQAQQRAWAEAARKMEEEMVEDEMQAAQSNWRPMISYTANLSRMGDWLLNTNAVWRKLSLRDPEGSIDRKRFLVNNQGPQYPWYWSATVLAVLFGLSAWILHYRVRSLDRLR